MLVNIVKSYLTRSTVRCLVPRNFAASTQASDPIQKLFVDKIREYDQKARTTSEGLVDATPQVVKGLKEDLERVARSYGIKDEKNIADLGLKFDAETKIDPIDLDKE